MPEVTYQGQQTRMLIGPLVECGTMVELVMDRISTDDGGEAMWHLPGGRKLTTTDLYTLARDNGWRKPVISRVPIFGAPETL